MRFRWTSDCQNVFDKLKPVLRSEPVLLAPNFNKEFKLAVDASDIGAGGVLLQEDSNSVDHPVCYFSKTFNKHQKNYSTVEKKCLSLILALQNFEVYLTSSSSPIVVFSDHNPLTFIHKIKNKRIRGCSDGVCCYRNTILPSGISGEKVMLFLMPFKEHDVLTCGFL